MSQSIASSLPAAPTTIDFAQNILATMAALSGVATDYNIGSQLRTFSESTGSVIEMQGVAAQSQAYLGLTYGSISAFGIIPSGPQYSTGNVTFSTSQTTAVPATQNVSIDAGTILQTQGGVQFQTTADVILETGASSISVQVQALVAGTTGNVSAQQITTIVTGIGYPLYASNPAATTGGAAAESPSGTLARFAAKAGSLGIGSPYAVANAAIGISYGAEVVKYSSLFEPWVAAGSGAGSGTAGFTVFIDNGQGTASANLVAAVQAKLLGNYTAAQPGNRPPGVPFSVQAVTPVYSSVSVTGTLLPYIQSAAVETNVQTAVNAAYSAQGIGGTISQSTLSASVANAGEGYFTGLTVALSTSGGSAVPTITAAYNRRNILLGLAQNITPAALTP